MMDYKYKISVVIPIYKVEKYLAETIDSVIYQTIGFEENIEIILVNDGSPDNCDNICRFYQNKFPDNITYLVKENGGLSSARNYGFESVHGKYVNFLDADDKWDKLAFEKAYDFFEKHFNDIDLLASRVRFFDAKDKWHVLDYKYQKGTRVVDVLKEENSVQVHVTSVFMKTDAIRNMRFNEKVRFGEDGLFSNTLILNKLKYGVVDDCVYYYRKRTDGSSLTQIQIENKDYYTDSPRLYYKGLINESTEKYGYVIPYIQNVLAYDIGWRVRSCPSESIRKDIVFFAGYLEFLSEILNYIDDKVFLRSKVHKRIEVKCAFYRLKNPGKELADLLRFDFDKKSIYAGDVRLYNFNKDNHSAFIITECVLKDRNIFVSGLVSQWLLSCGKNDLSFVLKVNNEIIHPELFGCTTEKRTTVFGETLPYLGFSECISLSDRDDEIKVSAALAVGNEYMDVTVKYKSEVDCVSSETERNILCTFKGIPVY